MVLLAQAQCVVVLNRGRPMEREYALALMKHERRALLPIDC